MNVRTLRIIIEPAAYAYRQQGVPPRLAREEASAEVWIDAETSLTIALDPDDVDAIEAVVADAVQRAVRQMADML